MGEDIVCGNKQQVVATSANLYKISFLAGLHMDVREHPSRSANDSMPEVEWVEDSLGYMEAFLGIPDKRILTKEAEQEYRILSANGARDSAVIEYIKSNTAFTSGVERKKIAEAIVSLAHWDDNNISPQELDFLSQVYQALDLQVVNIQDEVEAAVKTGSVT